MSDEYQPAPYSFNRHTGEVTLPEAGEGRVIVFDVKAFEALHSAYGDDYIETIIKRLSKMDAKVYQAVLAATVRGGYDGGVPWNLKWMEVNVRILDALNLAIYGKTYAEQKDENEKEMMKRLEELEGNPQLAATLQLLSSTSVGKPEPEQG